ncbi:MAG: hypothetical protein D6712_18090 [Chloroflexi bacterium]|nr:MAG: hypothetical protein D6712_18090 [Chloroflexota bacterium]
MPGVAQTQDIPTNSIGRIGFNHMPPACPESYPSVFTVGFLGGGIDEDVWCALTASADLSLFPDYLSG